MAAVGDAVRRRRHCDLAQQGLGRRKNPILDLPEKTCREQNRGAGEGRRPAIGLGGETRSGWRGKSQSSRLVRRSRVVKDSGKSPHDFGCRRTRCGILLQHR